MKCYICEKKAKKKHVIGEIEYWFCGKCNKAYNVAMKGMRKARRGLYVVE